MDKAILVDGVVVPIIDLTVWGRWMENADRHVAEDWICENRVSTVFLGLNHSYDEGELWFETMIFGPRHKVKSLWIKEYISCGDELYIARYASLEKAKVGHAIALEWLRERMDLSKKYQLQLTEGNRNEIVVSGSLPTGSACN